MTIILILFSLEYTLNLVNYRNLIGINWQGRELNQNLTLQQQQTVDENGIIVFLKDAEKYMQNYIINEQGFRSIYNFDSLSIKNLKDTSKVFMFVGDSHTEGCCASPISHSFVDLIDKKKEIVSLNFGVGATDPLQYKLIINKYLNEIQPDLLIIPFCLGNDFMFQDRTPSTSLPLCFQTNFNWVDTRLPFSHPNYKPDTYFQNWEEARSFYLEWYTVSGIQTSFIEKNIIESSNILQLIYHLPKAFKKKINKINNYTKYSMSYNENISYGYIYDIKSKCDELNINFLLVGVPTIKDIDKNQEILNKKYQSYFNDIKIHIPNNIDKSDFVSYQNDHFVNTGHEKFANFILNIIDSTTNYQALSNDSLSIE